MKRLKFIIALFLVAPLTVNAQKAELAQAKSALKTGRDVEKVQKSLQQLLNNSEHRQNDKLWTTVYRLMQKRYDEGNEKLYLKQKYDTAALFNVTKEMFDHLMTFDSIDAQTNKEHGKAPKYRKKHAAELLNYRPNLFFGGTYFVKTANYAAAYDFFNLYLTCLDAPLFSKDADNEKDKQREQQAAYWATFCGYKMMDADKTLKFANEAEKDTSKLSYTLQYVAEAYKMKEDEIPYKETLIKGFNNYPKHSFFFPRIVDYYTQHQQADSALVLANEALKVDSNNPLFLYAKSTLLLNMGNNDECIKTSEQLISLSDTIAAAYYNKGTALLNKALKLEQTNNSEQQKVKIKQLYLKAMPCFETYRQLKPDDQQGWATALYRIYFNLNMGTKFDEIDNLLKKIK